jgi:hypothetical protein
LQLFAQTRCYVTFLLLNSSENHVTVIFEEIFAYYIWLCFSNSGHFSDHLAPSVTIRSNVSNIFKWYSWKCVYVNVGEVTLCSRGGGETRRDFLESKCRSTILSTHSTICRSSVFIISKLFIGSFRWNIVRDSKNIINVVICIFLWIEQKISYDRCKYLWLCNKNISHSSHLIFVSL